PLHISPLGPGWSSDLDVFVPSLPDPAAIEKLGWRSLDRLLERLGSDPNQGRWAVVEDGDILGCADFSVGDAPDPVRSVLNRCRRRGEVRGREIFELRTLVRSGHDLPSGNAAIQAAANGEAGLGGNLLAAYADAPPIPQGPAGFLPLCASSP